MDGSRDGHTSEVNQREKETKYYITTNWNLKKDTNRLIHKTETDKIQKINTVTKEEGGSDKLGVWG